MDNKMKFKLKNWLHRCCPDKQSAIWESPWAFFQKRNHDPAVLVKYIPVGEPQKTEASLGRQSRFLISQMPNYTTEIFPAWRLSKLQWWSKMVYTSVQQVLKSDILVPYRYSPSVHQWQYTSTCCGYVRFALVLLVVIKQNSFPLVYPRLCLRARQDSKWRNSFKKNPRKQKQNPQTVTPHRPSKRTQVILMALKALALNLLAA